jgi:hypothetical protein
MIIDFTDTSDNNYDILYESKLDTRREPVMKRFFKSLKITFSEIYNKKDKTEWMNTIKIFSILDTHHLNNLIFIYNENILLRYNSLDKYLSGLNKGFQSKNVGYFVVALQNFLQ